MPNITHSAYLAYEARRAPKQPKSTDACSDESELHQQILDECRRRGWIALHGSMAHRTFRTEGENDFHCLLPNGMVLFVECKTRTSKLTPEQRGMAAWFSKLGHHMHIIRSFEQFLELCNAVLGGQSSCSRSVPSLEN